MAITAPPEPVYFESGHTDQVSVASSYGMYTITANLIGEQLERQIIPAGA